MASLLRECLTRHGHCGLFLALLLLLLLVLVPGHRAGVARNVSAIFMFGDSTVDSGNNNGRATLSKANFPPYGQDFPGGVATGRFCNGKIMGDMIASRLGVKELIPPYLSGNIQVNDLLTGVVFGSGGSGYDPVTCKITTAIQSTGQLELFEEYKEKLKTLVGEEIMTKAISDAIYFISMGANDLANNYFLIPLKQHQYDLSSYVDFLISKSVNFTLKLNHMGAKRIGLFGLPPIGCSPSQIILGGQSTKKCDPLRNQASELFNSKIKKEIDQLNVEHNTSGRKLVYIDFYHYLLDLVEEPAVYGFKEVSKGCCGSTLFDASVFIAYHHPCPNVSDYIYWDGFHPTEKAYKFVVDKLIVDVEKHLMYKM